MRRVFGGGFDEVLARQDANGNVDWYAADRQGSVHALFDNSETLSGEVAYDAFGNVTSGTLADRYGYAGREWDDVLGLQYNRDRMYNPSAGRWLSDDPAGFAAGLTNLASYVGNDPLNWADPSGLEGDDEGSAFANGPVCADAQTMALMEYLVNRPQTSGGPVDSDDGPPPALNPDGTLQELTPENVRKMGGTVVWKADGTVEYTYYAHGDMDNGARVTGRLDSNGRVIEQQIIGAHNQMQQFEKNWAENLVDGWRDVREVVHTGLDVLGMIPGVGAIPDLINGGIYLLEGDYENAALSGVAAIPGIGDAAGAAKIGRKIIGKGDDAIKGAKGAGKPPAIKPSTPKPTQPHHPGAPPSSTLRPNANPPGTPRGLIGCFVAGTMLLTLRGLVPIELLRRGDFVLSQSEDDPKGLPEYKMVLETHQRYSAVIAITIDGHVIRMTQDHPLYVLDGRGWVQAHDLKAEDQVQGLDGRALKVGAIDCAVKKEVVYNLTVADYHTFFIGAEEWDTAVWVHNVDPCATPPPAKKRPGTRGHPDHIKDVRGPGLDQANSIAGPGERVVTEGRIEGFPKIKRRPDNQVIGVDGKTRVVIESERLPEGPYHKKRIKQLKRAGIEVITRILQ